MYVNNNNNNSSNVLLPFFFFFYFSNRCPVQSQDIMEKFTVVGDSVQAMLTVFELKSKTPDKIYDTILFMCHVKVCSNDACKLPVSFLFSL